LWRDTMVFQETSDSISNHTKGAQPWPPPSSRPPEYFP
jgi:hypothetical protein